VLSFRDRTPSALTARPPSPSDIITNNPLIAF
jgi:hypothetical protein